jgi:hypothetical protein
MLARVCGVRALQGYVAQSVAVTGQTCWSALLSWPAARSLVEYSAACKHAALNSLPSWPPAAAGAGAAAISTATAADLVVLRQALTQSLGGTGRPCSESLLACGHASSGKASASPSQRVRGLVHLIWFWFSKQHTTEDDLVSSR